MSLVTGAVPQARQASVRRAHLPSSVLIVLATAPALVVTAWLVATFPLVWVGQFRLVTAVPLALVLAVVVLRFAMPPLLRAAETLRAPWWSVAATAVVAGVFLVFAAATHSEQVILHRDNGSYAQIGYILAHSGKLDKPVPAAAFGHSASLVNFESGAFYRVGGQLVPQFMTGWPTMVAAGWWAGGWSGELVVPALVGGAALLAVAGLTARLVGPRWAPLAALVTALAFPVLKNSQTTFSEMPAVLLLVTAVHLLAEFLGDRAEGDGTAEDGTAIGDGAGAAAGADPGDPRTAADAAHGRALAPFAFIAGLVLGVGELVRLDLMLDMALLMPVAAWLWVRRRAGVGAWLAGAFFGLALGGLDARFLTWPYIKTNMSSAKLAAAALVVSCVVSFLVAALVRRRGVPARLWRLVPALGTAVTALIGLALLIRPYVTIARGPSDSPSAIYLTYLQRLVGLAPAPSRTYAEQSLRWTSWYVGWPLLVAAFAGALVLTWRVLHGRELRWAAALPVYVVSAALQLWRPSITPDHPYADRRLVTVVLPGAVLMAVWAAAAVTRAAAGYVRAQRKATSPQRRALPAWLTPAAATAAGAVVAAALFVVPAAAATAPVAAKRTELGEVGAITKLCRVLSPTRDSVVLVDPIISGQWMAPLRNQCHVPAAQLPLASPQLLGRVAADIAAAGRTPVFAASSPGALLQLGYPASALKKGVVLENTQDQQQILKAPTGNKPMADIQFWYTLPRGH